MKPWSLTLLLLLAGCASGANPVFDEQTVINEVRSEEVTIRVVQVVSGLEHPWALEFLPDGRYLVTERPGRMWVVDGARVLPLRGLPEVRALGQGGLMDVIQHPHFKNNGVIYISYAADYGGGVGTRVARAVLEGTRLRDLDVIFQMDPPGRGGSHFGSRLAFDDHGYLYVTTGDRGQRDLAQHLDTHHGKVVRLHDDGRVPDDNPFVGRADAHPETYSYGHRNLQGMVFDSETGLLWTHEHGPRGGDELNSIRPGLNYGWPLATHGEEYRGGTIGTVPEALDEVENPKVHWTPSIAPCGMAQHRAGNFPEWEGNLFVGALVQQHIRRVVLEGETVVHQEELLRDRLGRIREVAQGPDGNIWFTTDARDGGIFRMERVNAH